MPPVPSVPPAHPVPPGPGVRPPFAAPPTQRDQRRIWLGIAAAVTAFALCCGGGIASCVGIGVWLGVEQQAESRSAVTRYLDPLVDGQYSKAYEQQCSTLRDQETSEEYAARVSDRPRLQSYEIGTIATDTSGEGAEMATLVDVTLRYELGPQAGQLKVVFDSADKKYRVCGGDV
ncbi:MAG: hypothetical protein H0T78_11690 [Longispora sp.]|nr:hypothetical protein [Longispora sp. (in: high G+C Gram-positive bacteria)]